MPGYDRLAPPRARTDRLRLAGPPVELSRPQDTVVSVEQAKAWLELKGTTTFDETVGDLVESVTDLVERAYGLSLISKRYRAVYRGPGAYAALPRGPFLALVSITEIDTDGTTTAKTLTDYYVEEGFPPRLVAKSGDLFSGYGQLRVVYAAGFRTLTTASGAGSASTTLTLADALLNSLHADMEIQVGSDLTTIASVTSTTVAELSAAQTWNDGAPVTLGRVPPLVMQGFRTGLADAFDYRNSAETGKLLVELPMSAHRVLSRGFARVAGG